MKLIKTIILHFKEGNSDKIYEVDLCNVGPDEYVVNFRYGRRDSNLKEGTKTVFPISLTEAEVAYTKLVLSKTKKGYTEFGDATERTISTLDNNEIDTPSSDRLIQHLTNAISGSYDNDFWDISRVIWRVGQIRLECENLLLQFYLTEDEMFNYSLIWAIGRCGTEKSVPFLEQTLKDSKTVLIQKITTESLLLVSNETQRKDIDIISLNKLPDALHQLVKNEDYEGIRNKLHEYLFELSTNNNEYLSTLYSLTYCYPRLHLILYEVLAKVPLAPNYFKQVRSVFKSAELRSDDLMFAMLAKRIETGSSYYNSSSYGLFLDNNWLSSKDLIDEKKKQDSRLAYSSATKKYLQLRINRLLQIYGTYSSSEFVNLATEILLTYNNTDAKEPREDTRAYYNYETRTYNTTVKNYDAYSSYDTLNTILYSNSNRYVSKFIKWIC